MWVGGQKKSNQPVRTAILLVVLLNQIILRHIIHDIKYIHNSGTLTPSASTKDHTNGRI